MDENNEKPEQKMVGAYLTNEYREKLGRILEHHHRTFRGMLETWIDEETRIVERSAR